MPWRFIGLFLVGLTYSIALALFQTLYITYDEPLFGGNPSTAAGESITPAQLLAFLVAQLAAQLTALLAALLGFRLFFGAKPEDWGLVTSELRRDVCIALVAALAFLPPLYAMQAVLHRYIDTPHVLIQAPTESNDVMLRLIVLVAAGLWVPIWEELFFRVILQGWLERILVHRRHSPEGASEIVELTAVGGTGAVYSSAAPVPCAVAGSRLRSVQPCLPRSTSISKCRTWTSFQSSSSPAAWATSTSGPIGRCHPFCCI